MRLSGVVASSAATGGAGSLQGWFHSLLLYKSFLLSPPPHHHSGFLCSLPIPSTLFSLTYFILDTSPFIIVCPRCDFAFPLPFLTSLRGFSCSSLPPPNIPPTAHHFCTFPNEKEGWNESILPSFHHFTLLRLSFWSTAWQYYHLLLRHIIPAGSLQTPDQKEGLKFLNSSHLVLLCGSFPKRATVWDGGE